MQVVKGKQYVRLLLKALILPFFFILTSYLLIFLFSTIYFNQTYKQIKQDYPKYSEEKINEIYDETLTSEQFQNDLANYLSDQSLLIILITVIIFIPIFIKKYRKYNIKSTKLKPLDILKLIGLGLFLAVFLNIIIYYLNELLNLTNRYQINDKTLWITLLTTGIIGPILEEFLFRGILYNQIKEFNSQKTSLLITSIIFALIHSTLTQMIYAFIFSLVLIKVYDRFKTLIAPIIVHIIANTIITLSLNYLISFNLLTSIIILLVCLNGFINLSKATNLK